MFLHGEDIASITNTVQMQECKNAKMQKCKVFLHPIDLQYDIIFLPLQNLCISLQKGRKGCFWGVVFALKCPIERTKPTETRWVFVFLVFGYMSSWTKFMLKVRGVNSQQPMVSGCLLKCSAAWERPLNPFSQNSRRPPRFAFFRFCKRKRKGGFGYTLLNQ